MIITVDLIFFCKEKKKKENKAEIIFKLENKSRDVRRVQLHRQHKHIVNEQKNVKVKSKEVKYVLLGLVRY